MEVLGIPSDAYESLEARRLDALEKLDKEELNRIIEQARQEDGWDESDGRYAHLIEQCSRDIRDIEIWQGQFSS